MVLRLALLLPVLTLAVASCAPAAPLLTSPRATPPAVCPLEGCSRDAWSTLGQRPASICASADEGTCRGLSAAACTDEALASWAALGGRGAERDLGCVAQMLSEACAQGEARACGFAGRIWLDGKGLHDKDVDRGMRLLTTACDGGVALACLVGSKYLADASTTEGAPDTSNTQHRLEMEYACLSGQGEACLQVGLLVRAGDDGFPQDLARAVEAYSRGCNLGDSRSCNNLGDALSYGEGVDRDLERGVEAFDKSCHLGEALGCANLGFRFERGLGVARDAAKARSLYRDACNVGSAYACLHVELAIADRGVHPKDSAAELERWSRACERGRDGRACAFLGLMYDDGPDGLARDEPKSQAAMARGCDLGEPRACDWVRAHTED